MSCDHKFVGSDVCLKCGVSAEQLKADRDAELLRLGVLIDISQMSKAEVLMRLYNGGFNDVNHVTMGIAAGELQRLLPPMTLEQAQALIDEQVKRNEAFEPRYRRIYFDYVWAKALKVDLTGDTLDPRLYDRDCGRGAAARALGVTGVEW